MSVIAVVITTLCVDSNYCQQELFPILNKVFADNVPKMYSNEMSPITILVSTIFVPPLHMYMNVIT